MMIIQSDEQGGGNEQEGATVYLVLNSYKGSPVKSGGAGQQIMDD